MFVGPQENIIDSAAGNYLSHVRELAVDQLGNHPDLMREVFCFELYQSMDRVVEVKGNLASFNVLWRATPSDTGRRSMKKTLT